MRPLIERFVRGESGVAAYSLVAAVLMLIGAGAWVNRRKLPSPDYRHATNLV